VTTRPNSSNRVLIARLRGLAASFTQLADAVENGSASLPSYMTPASTLSTIGEVIGLWESWRRGEEG